MPPLGPIVAVVLTVFRPCAGGLGVGALVPLAKYQGTVVLWCVIGPDGRVHDIRVQRSLGLGLDEKAIEAVKTWKFDPSKKDGVPVAVQIGLNLTVVGSKELPRDGSAER